MQIPNTCRLNVHWLRFIASAHFQEYSIRKTIKSPFPTEYQQYLNITNSERAFNYLHTKLPKRVNSTLCTYFLGRENSNNKSGPAPNPSLLSELTSCWSIPLSLFLTFVYTERLMTFNYICPTTD